MFKPDWDEFGRPCWDLYFMTLAFIVSQRSLDQFTKHGTICVNDDKTILSTGYNGPARNRNDNEIPRNRPEKYDHFLHSESAAIINAARQGICLKNSIFYVTGQPCEKCTNEIINVGAKKVIYGEIKSNCIDSSKQKIIKKILENQKIEFIEFTQTNKIIDLLSLTKEYIVKKAL